MSLEEIALDEENATIRQDYANVSMDFSEVGVTSKQCFTEVFPTSLIL